MGILSAGFWYHSVVEIRRRCLVEQTIRDSTANIQLDPADAHAYFLRGNAYLGERRLAQAVKDLTEAIRLSPSYAQAYYARSLAHKALGESEQARDDLNEALRLDPTCAVIG